MKVRIGVLGIQGAVSEHVNVLNETLSLLGHRGSVGIVRKLPELEAVDALVIPGGESTTIAKLLVKFGLYEEISKRAEEGMPIMGTCAGAILLAKEGGEEVEKTDTKLLELMDMSVDRNAFGRQRESFELAIEVEGFDHPFHAVFIRAPAILQTWGRCNPLSRLEDVILAARQDNLLALTFHPELTQDTRFHALLVQMI